MNRGSGVESLEMGAFAQSGQRLLYKWMRLTAWVSEDLSHLKLTQLRYYLKEHNLKISGNKKDLIKRIKDFQMLGH